MAVRSLISGAPLQWTSAIQALRLFEGRLGDRHVSCEQVLSFLAGAPVKLWKGRGLCCQLRHVPPVQMPFASLTVGQVFFAVVHEKTRPPLDAFDQAKQELPEEDHRCATALHQAPLLSAGRRSELWCSLARLGLLPSIIGTSLQHTHNPEMGPGAMPLPPFAGRWMHTAPWCSTAGQRSQQTGPPSLRSSLSWAPSGLRMLSPPKHWALVYAAGRAWHCQSAVGLAMLRAAVQRGCVV